MKVGDIVEYIDDWEKVENGISTASVKKVYVLL